MFLLPKFKGALTEQYVLQQLIATQENPVFYWAAEKGTAEVDFVLQRKQTVIPIEVKAEENLKAKSLKVYVEQFQPEQAFRFSMADFREQDWMVNVPLYGGYKVVFYGCNFVVSEKSLKYRENFFILG